MARWVQLPPFEEPEASRGRRVEIDGRWIAVFVVDGALHALDDTCPHRGGPLGDGMLEGRAVACPWHGWEFDVTTGCNVHSADVTVRKYPLESRADGIWVDLE